MSEALGWSKYHRSSLQMEAAIQTHGWSHQLVLELSGNPFPLKPPLATRSKTRHQQLHPWRFWPVQRQCERSFSSRVASSSNMGVCLNWFVLTHFLNPCLQPELTLRVALMRSSTDFSLMHCTMSSVELELHPVAFATIFPQKKNKRDTTSCCMLWTFHSNYLGKLGKARQVCVYSTVHVYWFLKILYKWADSRTYTNKGL